eukprot:6938898-Prymnesium_polylepis.4
MIDRALLQPPQLSVVAFDVLAQPCHELLVCARLSARAARHAGRLGLLLLGRAGRRREDADVKPHVDAPLGLGKGRVAHEAHGTPDALHEVDRGQRHCDAPQQGQDHRQPVHTHRRPGHGPRQPEHAHRRVSSLPSVRTLR